MQIRPDVTLPMSDIYSRVIITEQILFTLVAEKNAGITGMWEVSHDLNELIEHYRRVFDIMGRVSAGEELSAEDRTYLVDTPVTAVCAQLMCRNNLPKYMKRDLLIEDRVMSLFD